MSPQFSIVIPTRNRPSLVKGAIRSILSQTFSDFEVLVLENSDTNSLSANEFSSDPRIKIIPSKSVLSMPDNWERGLDASKGDFIAYISDKDRLVATALEKVFEVMKTFDSSVFNYRKSWFDSENGSLSVYRCSNQASRQMTKPVLDAWFDTVEHYHNAPMIYSSFVRRSVVQRLKSLTGRFFVGNAPDVCSGVLLSANEDSYVLVDRVLSVAYSGDWSNGKAVLDHGDKHKVSKGFLREFGKDPIREIGLPPTISTAVAEVLYRCKATFPSLLSGYKINWRRCISNAIDEIQARKVPDRDKEEDIGFLQNHPYMKNPFSRARVHVDRWASNKFDTQKKSLSFMERAGRSLVRRCLHDRSHCGCWDNTVYLPCVHLHSFDEAMRYIERKDSSVTIDG